ncbi:MAG: trigger factor [Clostridia bacterium]
MKYKVKLEKGKATINFTISAEEWETEIESAYNKTKSKYAKEGFRKGHVPRKILENTYGADVFFEDAFNESFPKYFSKVLEEHTEIYPVEMPKVDFDSLNGDGLKFTAVVTLKPEITLGKYKGLKLKKVDVIVNAKDIDEQLASVQTKNARLIDVDRAVEDGDEVTIDYSGSVDGTKFDGGTAEKQTLVIGSKSFIPGFEEQVIGMKKGEEKDITVTFPEEYHAENLKGKVAIFAIKLHDIKIKQTQQIDDEFAKDYSEFNTLEEYKNDIRKNLTEERQKQATNEEDNNLFETIIKDIVMDIPQAMIESQIDSYVKEFEYNLMYQGLKIADYYKYTNSNEQQLRENYTERSKKAIESRLVLEAVIKAEGLKVDAKELDAKIKELAKQANKTIKDYKADMSKEHISYLKEQILAEKVLNFLREQNTFE